VGGVAASTNVGAPASDPCAATSEAVDAGGVIVSGTETMMFDPAVWARRSQGPT
jgi:hypothetical protein